MNDVKFELGHSLKLLSGRFNLRWIQARDLNEDMIGALLGNDRLADAEGVNPFTNYFNRLLLHLRRNLSRLAIFCGRRH
jgi:hypothetical protein